MGARPVFEPRTSRAPERIIPRDTQAVACTGGIADSKLPFKVPTLAQNELLTSFH